MEPRPVELVPPWLGDLPQLAWSWVTERLQGTRNFWLVTSRSDGFPQARPVWGLWDENRLFLSVGGGGLKRTRDLEGLPVTVHTDSAVEVVIIEGRLIRIANPRLGRSGTDLTLGELQRLVDSWNHKYARTWTVSDHGFNVAVRPETVLAWREDAEAHNADASGKWTFDR